MSVWTIIGIIAVLIVVYIIFVYNKLIVLKTRINNSWSQIDVQLKRRYDLIPNLVNTVKGYIKHEKTVLENLTKARASMFDAKSLPEKAKASNMMSDALKSLFAVAENYPNLKANQNFMMLQEELSGTEDKIAYSRQFYNDNVMSYNATIQQFPAFILANMFKFERVEFFKIEEPAKKVVKVEF